MEHASVASADMVDVSFFGAISMSPFQTHSLLLECHWTYPSSSVLEELPRKQFSPT